MWHANNNGAVVDTGISGMELHQFRPVLKSYDMLNAIFDHELVS